MAWGWSTACPLSCPSDILHPGLRVRLLWDSPQMRVAGPRRRPSPAGLASSRAHHRRPAARCTAGSGWTALPWEHGGVQVTPGRLGLVPETVPVAAARAPWWVVWCSCMSGRPTCPCKGPASFPAKAVPLGQSPLSTQSCWEARGAKPVLRHLGTRYLASPLCPLGRGSPVLRGQGSVASWATV